MTEPISPELSAYADQRKAASAEFITKLVIGETNLPHDAVTWAMLRNDLEAHMSTGSLADALAEAIQRLAHP